MTFMSGIPFSIKFIAAVFEAVECSEFLVNAAILSFAH